MHNYTINAAIQLVPVDADRKAYDIIDSVINIIQQSKLPYTVGAFNTTVQGVYSEVINLINLINEFLVKENCTEWLLNVQFHIKANNHVLEQQKTSKWHHY